MEHGKVPKVESSMRPYCSCDSLDRELCSQFEQDLAIHEDEAIDIRENLINVGTALRPELHDVLARNSADRMALDGSTAEIAANSPRYRRRSSTFIDGVHDVPNENSSPMAPAQLYSTMSGRLFHSGRIAIVLVGLPARGKT
jgi:hypothetical protein